MDPARMFKESLTSRPELENSQGQKRKCLRWHRMSPLPPRADFGRPPAQVRFVPERKTYNRACDKRMNAM